MTYKVRTTCRLCGGGMETVLPFGRMALTSLFPKPGEDAPRIPMTLCRCPECGLVQLAETTEPALMYREGYGYKSGTNEAMRRHLADVVGSLIPYTKHGDAVLDIGCNDGTLLKCWPVDRVKVGFDPVADDVPDCHVVKDYFRRGAYLWPKASVVTSLSMFYDLDDPLAFAREVGAILAPEGVWVVEVGYLGALIAGAWDGICHEHLTYWGLAQFVRLANETGLRVFDAKLNPVNGGTLQVWLCHDQASHETREAVGNIIESEIGWDEFTFRDVAHRIKQWAALLKETVEALDGDVMACGASTKGNFTLQMCGLDVERVSAAVDRSPHKWGRRTPGTDIPIISEDEMREDPPAYLLVLPWHFREGILERESAVRGKGTRFIFPLPEIEIV